MSLPVIDTPTFEMNLLSIKDPITYRPFLVKEEKLLLMAMEAGDQQEIVQTSKQIINNCIVEGNINLDLLPSFDIEYMFLRLRANSVNSTSSLTFKDPDDPEAKPQKIDVDLLTIEVKWPKDIKNKIDLGEGISMSLKYPTYDEIGSINNENAAEGTMQLIRICADKIYSGVDTVDDLKDYSEQEIGNFLDSLKGEALKGIQLFFEDMPKLSHTIDYEIKGKKKQHTFEGIADFFTYA